MDWDASITPGSTSNKEDSIILAIKGAAEMVKGTMAAVVPMEEPTIILVKGMMATMRMINGVDLVALTIAPKIALIPLFSKIWPLSVTVRIIPRGKPIKVAKIVEATTM